MKIRFRRVLLLSLLAVATPPYGCAASDAGSSAPDSVTKHELRYRLPQGTRFELDMVADQDIKQATPERDASAKIHHRRLFDATVQSATPDGLDIRFEYKERSYVSDNPAFGDTADFSQLIGKQVEVLVAPAGKVSSFRGFLALPEVALVKERRTMTRQDYVNDFVAVFPELPNAPVGVGDSWNYTTQVYERFVAGQIGITIDMEYTVMADTVTAGLKCFKCLGKYTVKGRGQGIDEGSGIRLDVDLSGSGTDTMYFAYEKGMFLGSQSRMVIKGTASNMPLRFATNLEYDTRPVVRVKLK